MNTKLDSEPIYDGSDKYIKTYGDKVNTSFRNKKVQRENASCKCLSLIMLDSVIRANKKYHQQTLLGECKYEIKIKNFINNVLDPSSCDEYDNGFDNESNNDESNDKFAET